MKKRDKLRGFYQTSNELYPSFDSLSDANLNRVENSPAFKRWSKEKRTYKRISWFIDAVIIMGVIASLIALFGNEIITHI